MDFKQLEQYFIEETAGLYDQEEAKQLYGLTVAYISGWNRGQLLIHHHEAPSADDTLRYHAILADLKKGRPLQHIIAESWFYGLKFKVNSSVLIPRPETEELVEWILAALPEVNQEPADRDELQPGHRLIDLGTGSGCIAIAIKKNRAAVAVDALDVSVDALQVARENALSNDTPVNFIHADILNYSSELKYDVIVSNPPYIKEDEREAMHKNVLDHEPHLALFVTDENPLVFYKGIADFAIRQLAVKGKLFFEINEYLGKETVEMLKDKGFINIILKQDMQGKDRMICCEKTA